MRCKWIKHLSIGVIGLAGGCGLFGPPRETDVRYSADENLIPLRAVDSGGDFALFYAGREKAEVPVRVESGDSIGFIRLDDGRLKAVAGPFKMDMNPTVREAYWKRINHGDE